MRGSGPLVLIHGFAGSPRVWDCVIERLGPASTVERVLVGGHCGAPTTSKSFVDEVDRIAEGLRVVGIREATLCGYSLGGRIGLGLLVRHARLFRRAVLIGASPGMDDSEDRAARVARDEAWAEMLEQRGVTGFVEAWERQPMFESQARLDAGTLTRQREIRLSHEASGLAWALRTLGTGRMPGLLPAVREVSCPVYFVAGELDTKFRGIAEAMASAAPRGELFVAAGCGHNAVLEAPHAVVGLLREDSAA